MRRVCFALLASLFSGVFLHAQAPPTYGIDTYPDSVGPDDLFTKEGFISADRDMRGRYLTEGTFIEVQVLP